MKYLDFICLTILCLATLRGHAQNEFVYVDHRALCIPAAETHTSSGIAKFILSNFKTDREKVRAIYRWVTANIKYDKDSMYSINNHKDPDKKITETLRRRKGVCENYAALFNDISLKCGLQSFVVSGYTRESGIINSAGHAWCSVYIGNEWLLCDPTWDEGFSVDPNYFLIPGIQFIESHMPFDPLWQLLDHPASHHEFYTGNFNYRGGTPAATVVDSVYAYLQSGDLQKLEATASRMKQAGINNELIKNHFRYIQMQIGIFYEDKDMNLYNEAVKELNKASSIFNDFVQYRNNEFVPEKPDSLVLSMLDPIETLVDTALIRLDGIGKVVPNYQYDPAILRNRLLTLKKRLSEQEIFLKNYFSAPIPDRKKLFYK